MFPWLRSSYVILTSRQKGNINQDLANLTFGENWILVSLIIVPLPERDINQNLENFFFNESWIYVFLIEIPSRHLVVATEGGEDINQEQVNSRPPSAVTSKWP